MGSVGPIKPARPRRKNSKSSKTQQPQNPVERIDLSRGQGGWKASITWGPGGQIVSYDLKNGDQFARALALGGQHLVIGAQREGGGPGKPLPNSGAVYVLKRSTAPPLALARVRVAHLAPDIPTADNTAIDVFIDGERSPIRDLAFGNSTGFIELTAGEHLFGIAPANEDPIFSFTAQLTHGQAATLVAIRTVSNRGLQDPLDVVFLDGSLVGLQEGNGRSMARSTSLDTY